MFQIRCDKTARKELAIIIVDAPLVLDHINERFKAFGVRP